MQQPCGLSPYETRLIDRPRCWPWWFTMIVPQILVLLENSGAGGVRERSMCMWVCVCVRGGHWLELFLLCHMTDAACSQQKRQCPHLLGWWMWGITDDCLRGARLRDWQSKRKDFVRNTGNMASQHMISNKELFIVAMIAVYRRKQGNVMKINIIVYDRAPHVAPAFPSSTISFQLRTIVGQSVDCWFKGKITLYHIIPAHMCQPRSLQIKNTERDGETEKIVMNTFLAHWTVLNETKKKEKKKESQP